ncbi:PTS sugar transporter subunit IIB [Sinanaerobacter chloroacetimidivorans]|uniref:PTS sugar transporter subunit IIB n=1 Tax=Sinanaerobacter chloroacetimidivorans TaxID=2818044 RepID=A0A8J7W679_9FIRM|nr:PTS sugar transporter subunit IIB [Sinanaerobacter chloroacetimidivorans]MBR0599791.1 PTS sugar transporter subunit IIB [Sinanaerobacter chloroacetimidivorans]
MKEVNVLIVCGGGASSGFLAQSVRKSAQRRGLAFNIKARSESEVEDYINDIDVLLFGPHLKYMEEELKKAGETHQVPVAMIDQSIYGRLDGEKCVDVILELLKNNI